MGAALRTGTLALPRKRRQEVCLTFRCTVHSTLPGATFYSATFCTQNILWTILTWDKSAFPNSTNSLVFVMEKQRPGLYPRTVHVGFVVDKRALEQVFLPVILFSSVSIIPLMLQTYLCLHVAVTRRRRDDWEHSKNNALMEIGEQWIEKKTPI